MRVGTIGLAELYRYLRCGLLAFGFALVRRLGCGREELVAFSCEGRSVWPSCGARRMSDTAAHLVDEVLPDVRARPWVLSFYFRNRFLLACDPKPRCAVRRIFVRSVLSFVERRARKLGHCNWTADPCGGALRVCAHERCPSINRASSDPARLAVARLAPM